jgi:hypothetical protein
MKGYGLLQYTQMGDIFFPHERDYDNNLENGVVVTRKLGPGNYEIYEVDMGTGGGMSYTTYTSNQPFSIKFTVRSGETTYLGNYQAHKLTGRNWLGLTIPAGAVFTVSNREQADLELARKKLPDVVFGPVTNATPEVEAIANPIFVKAALPQPLAQ